MDEPTEQPTEQMINDVDIRTSVVKNSDGKTYPVLNIGIVIEPGYASHVAGLILRMCAQADAVALEANQASPAGLVLPDTAGRLYLPTNGHGPRG